MPRDAKIGLILGIGVVLLVTLIFFNRGRDNNRPPAAAPSPNTAQSPDSKHGPRVVPVRAALGADLQTRQVRK